MLLLAVGCRASRAIDAGTPLPSASTVASSDAAAGTGKPLLRVLLDDPRLAACRAAVGARNWAAAAQSAEDALPPDASLRERCAWDYLSGRVWSLASEPSRSAVAFRRASTSECPLAAFARWRLAQSGVKAGFYDEVLALVPSLEEAGFSREGPLLAGDALAARGDRREAALQYQRSLGSHPNGSRWPELSIRVASAMLDGVLGPPESHALEAWELASRVVVDVPREAQTSGAMALRKRAAALLPKGDPRIQTDLTSEELAKQAQSWLDAGEVRKAFDRATLVWSTRRTGPAGCRAALVRANAAAKLRPPQSIWQEVPLACEGEPDLVTALYQGAKAQGGKDPLIAIDWYGRIERLFPTHRLADDARLRSGVLLQSISEDQARDTFATLPDLYPDGDMIPEALFRLALSFINKGEWEAAKAPLDRIALLTPRDRHWATAGRAEYFLARAASETGDEAGAQDRYARIVRDYPLAFYMNLALSRLSALGREQALRSGERTSSLDAHDASDSSDAHEADAHEADASDAAQQAVEGPGLSTIAQLLEVNDAEAAQVETLRRSKAANSGGQAIARMARLFHEAGFADFGRGLFGQNVTDYMAHYPQGPWRMVWEAAYPRAFEELVAQAAAQYGVPRPLVWGIMREESSFVADARSRANATGLMQLMASTAAWVAEGTRLGHDEASLREPETSIALGTRLLDRLRRRHTHTALVAAAYNAGSGAVDRWLAAYPNVAPDVWVELMPFDETRNYVKRVMASEGVYAYLYEREAYPKLMEFPSRWEH